MGKLINAYKASPTEANKLKLAKYLKKHNMAICLASADELAVLKSLNLI